LATKEERRKDILKATMKVISESGFERATIEDIAKEAGIGKGTVYEYFESKNTLFLEMCRYGAETYQEGLLRVLTEGDNMLAKICNFSSYSAEFMSQHIDVVNSAMSGQSLPEEMRLQMMENWAVIHQSIEDIVREGVRSSELSPNIDPEIAAAVIIGGINQYMMKKIFMDRERPEKIDHGAIAKIILAGLVKE
jgi:AcrR family transcriptional regulator